MPDSTGGPTPKLMSAVRKGVSSLTLGVAILALIFLLCGIGSVLFATRFVEVTIGYAVDNIAKRSGLSVFLVWGISIFATIPFFWAVGKFTKNIWGLINLGWNSMSFYSNWYGRIIICYVGVYFVVMYLASLQALNYKYCVETPERIWTSDSPGVDPVYGLPLLKPCPMDLRLRLREQEGYVRHPNELTIADAATYKWFASVGGVWYSALPNNEYRFFDGRGRDPYNGQELKPVTRELVERVTQLQIAKAQAKKQAEDEAAKQLAREQAKKQAEDEAAKQLAREQAKKQADDEAAKQLARELELASQLSDRVQFPQAVYEPYNPGFSGFTFFDITANFRPEDKPVIEKICGQLSSAVLHVYINNRLRETAQLDSGLRAVFSLQAGLYLRPTIGDDLRVDMCGKTVKAARVFYNNR